MKDTLIATLLTLLRTAHSQKMDAMVASQVVALDSLPDDTMRQARLLETLLPMSDEDVVMFMDCMLSGALADRPRFRGVMNAFLNFQVVLDAVDENRKRRWKKIARKEGHAAVLAILTGSPPRKTYYAPRQLDVNEQMEDRTLGHRKSLARCYDRQVLDRLLYDKHPGVVRILLNNPRIVERDVVKLAALQPTKAEALLEVFRHPRWIRRYPVKKALVFNPYTPVPVVHGLLGYLREPDLVAVERARRLSSEVRERAAFLLAHKRSRRRRTFKRVSAGVDVGGPGEVESAEEAEPMAVSVVPCEAEGAGRCVPSPAGEEAHDIDDVAAAFLEGLPDDLPLVPVKGPGGRRGSG